MLAVLRKATVELRLRWAGLFLWCFVRASVVLECAGMGRETETDKHVGCVSFYSNLTISNVYKTLKL
jgi:hypothetical protein